MAITLRLNHEDRETEIIENAAVVPQRKATIDTAWGIRAVDRLHYGYNKLDGNVTVSVYLSRS